jgi:hypothetical protein
MLDAWLEQTEQTISSEHVPMRMADTPPNVTGSLKKTRPATAIGSLFKAPTMLELSIRITIASEKRTKESVTCTLWTT